MISMGQVVTFEGQQRGDDVIACGNEFHYEIVRGKKE